MRDRHAPREGAEHANKSRRVRARNAGRTRVLDFVAESVDTGEGVRYRDPGRGLEADAGAGKAGSEGPER